MSQEDKKNIKRMWKKVSLCKKDIIIKNWFMFSIF